MLFHRDDLTLGAWQLPTHPTFACPCRAENVPSSFEFISYRNNLRRKLSIYFNKKRPLLNSYSKRRLAAMF